MSNLVNKDEEHLRLLSIFHYIIGGITAVGACFPIIYIIIGIIMLLVPEKMFETQVDLTAIRIMAWFFIIFAGLFVLLGWAFAVCAILTGSFLARKKHYTFCFVIAVVDCLWVPFGTILGVFSIIVLIRPSVKELFTTKIEVSQPSQSGLQNSRTG